MEILFPPSFATNYPENITSVSSLQTKTFGNCFYTHSQNGGNPGTGASTLRDLRYLLGGA